MNYMPFVSWGVYGGVSPLSGGAHAHYFVSWGMMAAVAMTFVAKFRRTFGPRVGTRQLIGLW